MTQIQPSSAQSPVIGMLKSEAFKDAISGILDKKAPQFVASCLSLVSQDKNLSGCDKSTVYSALLTSASLDLPVNQNLGFAYIIGYKSKDGLKAQFQMGYKGFIQLAMRSGQFKTISVSEIYEGQIVSENPLTGYVFDFEKKVDKNPENIIGYASYFSLINGFEKIIYMSKEELRNHGVKFSQTFKKGYGLWKDDFDSMAKKTVIKLLLSKFAPLSTEMQKGISVDQGVIDESMKVDYVDNDNNPEKIDEEKKRLRNFIEWSDSLHSLDVIKDDINGDESLEKAFNEKKALLSSLEDVHDDFDGSK